MSTDKTFSELYDRLKKILEDTDDQRTHDEAKQKLIVSASIKKYRMENRLTQEELASKLGFRRLEVVRWEKGLHLPREEAMAKMRSLGIMIGI